MNTCDLAQSAYYLITERGCRLIMLNDFTYSKQCKTNTGVRWQCSVGSANHCSAYVIVDGSNIVKVKEEHTHQPKTYYTNEYGLHYFIALRRGGPLKRKNLVLDSQILNICNKENEHTPTPQYLTAAKKRGRKFKKLNNFLIHGPRILDVRSTAEHYIQKSAFSINQSFKLGRRSKDSTDSSVTAKLDTPDTAPSLLQNMMVNINDLPKHEASIDVKIKENLKTNKYLLQIPALITNKIVKRGRPPLPRKSDDEVSNKVKTKKKVVDKSAHKICKISKRGRSAFSQISDDSESDNFKSRKNLLQKSAHKLNKVTKRGRPPLKRYSDDDVSDNLEAKKYLLQNTALKTKISKRGRPPTKRKSGDEVSSDAETKKYVSQKSAAKINKNPKRGRPPLKRFKDNNEAENLKAKKYLLQKSALKISKRGRPPKIRRNTSDADIRKAARLFLQSGLKLNNISKRGRPRKIDANQNVGTEMFKTQMQSISKGKGPFVRLTALKMHKFSKYVYSPKKPNEVTSTVTSQSLNVLSSCENDGEILKPTELNEKQPETLSLDVSKSAEEIN